MQVLAMIIIAIILLAIFLWLIRLFLKKKNPAILGLLFATIHLIFTTLILFMEKGAEEPGWGWMICMIIDFPLYPLLMFLGEHLGKQLESISMLFTYLFFAILGSLLYFFLGSIIGKIFNLASKRISESLESKGITKEDFLNKEDFLKPTKRKILLFLSLLLIFIFFVKSYPCNLSMVFANQPVVSERLEFQSLYDVIRNGFMWSEIIPDASSYSYYCQPFYLLLYFVYSVPLYLIACLISKTKLPFIQNRK